MRSRFWPAVVLVVGGLLTASPQALADEPTYSGPTIFQGAGACPLVGDQHICSGEVASYDGTLLDTDLTLPAQNTGTTHPLIVMLNGFGSTKHEWESTTDLGDGGDKYNWNSHWFAEHGYYVLTYTARGFDDPGPDAAYEPPTPGGTSGFPASGPRATIHLKSRDTEVRDTQWLAALVAASFPDVDPSRVAVTGGSYGGGESWLQASQAQWTFPHDCSASPGSFPDCSPSATFTQPLPFLQLQVAVPKYPWTDLAYSLAPNGHPGSGAGPSGNYQPPAGYCDVDQSLQNDPCYSSSQGDPNSDTGSGNPFGIVKSSYASLFFSYGHGASNGTAFQTEDSCDIPQTASIDSWFAGAMAGEPYDTAGVDNPIAAQIRHGLTECRASYYQDEGWKAQALGPRRVAIFSIQGWTDDLFTPVESFRQFKYLKSLDPLWPVEVALADVGHPRAKNGADTWHYLNQQAWQFLQSQIRGSHDEQTTITSQETICSGDQNGASTNDPNQSITALTPEGLSNGEISIMYASGGATDSAFIDPNGAADDPLLTYVSGQLVQQGADNCPGSTGPAQYTAVSAPLTSDRTYIGLGSVTVNYSESDPVPAQLDARVWVVPPGANAAAVAPQCQTVPPPSECPRLITRGAYRLDPPAYDSQTGQIRIPFFGNHFKFRVGDRIRLDLTQSDALYLRQTMIPSHITFTPPTLTLPTRESGTTVVPGG